MGLLDHLHNLPTMNVASLSFVFIFLPLSLLIYYVCPKKYRLYVLLISSLGFYALADFSHIFHIILSVAIDYAIVRLILSAQNAAHKKMYLSVGVVKNLAVIAYFLITAQVSNQIPALGVLVVSVSGIMTFSEAYFEAGSRMRNPLQFATYMLFFPRLYIGPLATPEVFFSKFEDTGFDSTRIVIGYSRLIEGLLKYAVLGAMLFTLHNSVKLMPSNETSVLGAWIFVLSFALSVYYTLSGLSDIARGVADLFGVNIPINFYYPFQSRTVTDFFERFNMTVGNFLKRTALIPLDSEKDDVIADILNTMLVGLLWGLWFGVRGNYILWGGYIALFMLLERYVYNRVFHYMPVLFSRFYTFAVVLVGLAICSGDTLYESARLMANMLGINDNGIPLLNDQILYVLSANWLLLLISFMFATSIVGLATNLLRKSLPRISKVLFVTLDTALLVLFTAITIGGGKV